MLGFPEPLPAIQDTGPRQLVKQAPRNRHGSWEEKRGSETHPGLPSGLSSPHLKPWLARH